MKVTCSIPWQSCTCKKVKVSMRFDINDVINVLDYVLERNSERNEKMIRGIERLLDLQDAKERENLENRHTHRRYHTLEKIRAGIPIGCQTVAPEDFRPDPSYNVRSVPYDGSEGHLRRSVMQEILDDSSPRRSKRTVTDVPPIQS